MRLYILSPIILHINKIVNFVKKYDLEPIHIKYMNDIYKQYTYINKK